MAASSIASESGVDPTTNSGWRSPVSAEQPATPDTASRTASSSARILVILTPKCLSR
ncbi:Uncharacterised protein [Mycobacterium tuberculosis]|nr:Uncharacterised protein [Mycobacterium tuberculosis]